MLEVSSYITPNHPIYLTPDNVDSFGDYVSHVINPTVRLPLLTEIIF